MCGIIGVFKHEGDANVEIYEGLLMLQHRGQDSGAPACGSRRVAWAAQPAAQHQAHAAIYLFGLPHKPGVAVGCARVAVAWELSNCPVRLPARRPVSACRALVDPGACLPPLAAGMVTTDWRKFYEYKNNGLVKDVFSKQSQLDALSGEGGPRGASGGAPGGGAPGAPRARLLPALPLLRCACGALLGPVKPRPPRRLPPRPPWAHLPARHAV